MGQAKSVRCFYTKLVRAQQYCYLQAEESRSQLRADAGGSSLEQRRPTVSCTAASGLGCSQVIMRLYIMCKKGIEEPAVLFLPCLEQWFPVNTTYGEAVSVKSFDTKIDRATGITARPSSCEVSSAQVRAEGFPENNLA